MPLSLPSVDGGFLFISSSPTFLTRLTLLYTFKMARSALLIGNISHARKEWDDLSSLLELKVGKHGANSSCPIC